MGHLFFLDKLALSLLYPLLNTSLHPGNHEVVEKLSILLGMFVRVFIGIPHVLHLKCLIVRCDVRAQHRCVVLKRTKYLWHLLRCRWLWLWLLWFRLWLRLRIPELLFKLTYVAWWLDYFPSRTSVFVRVNYLALLSQEFFLFLLLEEVDWRHYSASEAISKLQSICLLFKGVVVLFSTDDFFDGDFLIFKSLALDIAIIIVRLGLPLKRPDFELSRNCSLALNQDWQCIFVMLSSHLFEPWEKVISASIWTWAVRARVRRNWMRLRSLWRLDVTLLATSTLEFE